MYQLDLAVNWQNLGLLLLFYGDGFIVGLHGEERTFIVVLHGESNNQPGITPNDNTTHVPTAGSSAALTKPNHTPIRHPRAKCIVVWFDLVSFAPQLCARLLFVLVPGCVAELTHSSPRHTRECNFKSVTRQNQSVGGFHEKNPGKSIPSQPARATVAHVQHNCSTESATREAKPYT